MNAIQLGQASVNPSRLGACKVEVSPLPHIKQKSGGFTLARNIFHIK